MAFKTIRLKTRAKAYANLSWPVLPMHNIVDGHCSCSLGQDCGRPGKHPRTEHGAKDASTDLVQIRRWWRKWPDANVGIRVGEDAGIIVLDIDPRNGGSATLEALEAELGVLPETVTAKTGGGGLHLVFQHPDLPVGKDSAGKLLGPGIDVLANGALMVASPSRHISGRRYRWADGKSHRDLTPGKLPEAWVSKLCGTAAGADDVRQGASSQAITEGGRNTALTRIAGQLHWANLSPEAIRAAVLEENRTKCSPPLDAAEVERIVASVTRYAPGPGNRTDPAEQLLDIVLNNHFNGGRHLKFAADGQFWHYTGKLWEPVAKQWIEGRILEASKGNPIRTGQRTASLLHQVRALLEAKLATTGDPLSFLAEPPPVINCANGEVWITANGVLELRPHRPESFLRHCLDVTYDPKAVCPEYDRAISEIFALAPDPKDLVRHWNELFGYIIQPSRKIPIIPILLGSGDNGKTKLMHTVIKLLGSNLVHAQRVDDLEKNRFTMGSLFGKRLFIDDDVRAGVRLPDGILKTISEEKGYYPGCTG
jgi:putative DNA primase/helicase